MQRRMFPKSAMVLIVAIFGLLIMSCFSFAAEFSADYYQKMAGVTITGKIYVKGDKIRQEMIREGQKGVMIVRMDKEVIWHLMPEERMYMEMTFGKEHSAVFDKELEKIATKKYLGKEKVHGWVCDKYEIIYHDKSMGTATQWFSKRLNFPIKMEFSSPYGQGITEYKNIREKRLSDSLFEIPLGYKKMDMPMMP